MIIEKRVTKPGGAVASEAIILLLVQDRKPVESLKGKGDQINVNEFTEGRVCQRVILDKEIDRRIGREGYEEGEEPCDACYRKDKESRKHTIRECIIH